MRTPPSISPLVLWLVTLPLLSAALVGAGAGRPDARAGVPRFERSNACLACHNGLTTSTGEDVSIGAEWRGSIMANASRDPYWQASVRRETLDHPAHRAAIEDECATCHMPMARADAAADGARGQVFAHLPAGGSTDLRSTLAADGVSCTLCHQIAADRLGHADSFNGGFALEVVQPGKPRPVFGPFAIDAGRRTIMRSASGFQPAESAHVRQSELCATCHTLYTNALGARGEIVGRLPEQTPYLEWRHSAWREERSCQDCHMPRVTEATPFSSVLGDARPGWGRHSFRGGNAFMIRMLDRYREELGVEATAGELETSARTTLAFLQRDTARVSIARATLDRGRVVADVVVRNLAGHKLPTGYPSRRVWLHVAIRDAAGRLVFESGAVDDRGAIAGNDNDLDPTKVEPHYDRIERAEEVLIYESTLADAAGHVTTALLRAVRFVKDNRVLPRGFEKATADADIAVQGDARADRSFVGGGDTVQYVAAVDVASGPFSITVELLYQPIAFRWAQNLKQQRALEIDRFVSLYDAMASASTVRLASATAAAADTRGGASARAGVD